MKLPKSNLPVFALLVCLWAALTSAAPAAAAPGGEHDLVPTYGSGRYHLFIFSDYFCQPCQNLEKELDGRVQKLISERGVQVSFVDMPIYKLTPLYAKYFLYAVKAAKSYREVLQARKVLFDKASRFGAITEPQLVNALQAEQISLTPFDVQPVLAQYNGLIKKYQVRGTPTFVFVYTPQDVRKYVGDKDIKRGLTELDQALKRRR
ncbi:MAG: thioredoxin fold domain-containing protein [Syntrophobacterales bacterium]|nr:thioredoxin fold domain-containing protein [Syntrophobacterales bacterium]